MRRRPPARAPTAAVALLLAAAACTSSGRPTGGDPAAPSAPSDSGSHSPGPPSTPSPGKRQTGARHVAVRFRNPLPGMPPVLHGDIYAATRAGDVAAKTAHDRAYLYVPNSYGSPTTTVIDQRTHKIVRVLHTGMLSQHVTPSYDLRTLYVEASASNHWSRSTRGLGRSLDGSRCRVRTTSTSPPTADRPS